MFGTLPRGVLRPHTLERRLFGWLLALLLIPTIIISAIAFLAGSRSVELLGTLGAWDEVAQSGRTVLDAAAQSPVRDSSLTAALDEHQRNLSSSLTQARRWSFLGERVIAALPWAAFVLVLLLVGLSLWISRRIARELARPIGELAGWADRLGRGEPLPAASGSAVRDVSEVHALRTSLRDAEAKIVDAQLRAIEMERVRAWGEMARRVAHEMKNPLTPLRLAVHRLSSTTSSDSAMREPMEVIEQETARLDELAKQFAVLGRPAAGPTSDVDMVELVSGLLDTDVPSHIRTSVRVERDIPFVHGHYDALQRAARNLVRNAVEAIGSAAGTIDVRIERRAHGIALQIEDSGGGIPEERIQRIFEADFTLKAGGTGLGLAVVQQATAAHHGSVTVRNGTAGAVFEIWLPAEQAGGTAGASNGTAQV